MDHDDLCTPIKHIKNHIKDGISVNCPIVGCNNSYKVVSSLTSHLSRYHKTTFIFQSAVPSTGVVDLDSSYAGANRDVCVVGNGVADPSSSATTGTDTICRNNVESPLHAHVMLLLSLRCQHLIPASTVETFTKEISHLLDNQKQHVPKSVVAVLKEENVAESISEKVLCFVSSSFVRIVF